MYVIVLTTVNGKGLAGGKPGAVSFWKGPD
jgi:hypothetical protein